MEQSLPIQINLCVPQQNIVKTNKNKSVENINTIYYSIVVRQIIKNDDLNMVPLMKLTPNYFNQSMSIFERPNIPALVETQNSNSIGSSLSTSFQTSEISMEADNISGTSKITQLEREFGSKLPRIHASKYGKFVDTITKPDQIQMTTNILAHALVDNNTHSKYLLSHIDLNNNESKMNSNNIMICNDIMTPLMNDNNNNNRKQLPHNNNNNKFTVIGSAQFGNNNNGKQKQKQEQQTWIFSDPSELILGLQGVHHSEKAPIWMDLVCDHNTFKMISEHVRPKIHQLSIEDCITFECREKLELFDNYLFIRIETGTQNDINNNNNNHGQDKICMIIFKNMIITYH
eukprot:170482_1